MLIAPLGSGAQPTGKIYWLGYLHTASGPTNAFTEAFRESMRELGWVEGQNVVIHYRFAEGRFDRLPDLATELVQLKVDLIVASPSPAAVAAKNVTAVIPIVMAGSAIRLASGSSPAWRAPPG